MATFRWPFDLRDRPKGAPAVCAPFDLRQTPVMKLLAPSARNLVISPDFGSIESIGSRLVEPRDETTTRAAMRDEFISRSADLIVGFSERRRSGASVPGS